MLHFYSLTFLSLIPSSCSLSITPFTSHLSPLLGHRVHISTLSSPLLISASMAVVFCSPSIITSYSCVFPLWHPLHSSPLRLQYFYHVTRVFPFLYLLFHRPIFLSCLFFPFNWVSAVTFSFSIALLHLYSFLPSFVILVHGYTELFIFIFYLSFSFKLVFVPFSVFRLHSFTFSIFFFYVFFSSLHFLSS